MSGRILRMTRMTVMPRRRRAAITVRPRVTAHRPPTVAVNHPTDFGRELSDKVATDS